MTNFFASILVSTRKKRGVTQAEMAISLGLTRSTYANYESGQTEPNIETILKISKFLDISVDKLLGNDLSDVHLNTLEGSKEIGQNVHLNVHPGVHLKGKKAGKQGVSEQPLTADYTVELLLQTQQSFIKSLEQLNTIQSRRVADLEEEIRRYKVEIPKIVGSMEDQQMETG